MPKRHKSAGFHTLGHQAVEAALSPPSLNLGHYSTGSIRHKLNDITFCYNEITKVLVISSPIDPPAAYQAILDSITQRKINLDEYHLIVPLVGRGLTGPHTVTLYKAPGQNPTIFDPKVGIPQQLFAAAAPTKWGKALNFMKSLGHAIWSNFAVEDSQYDLTIANAPKGLEKFDYEGLGSQSFFDGVSDGLHTILICRAIVNLLGSNEAVNRENLVIKLNTRVAIKEANSLQAHLFKTDLKDFLKDALYETFGYPPPGILKSILKIPALPFKLLSAFCKFLINKLQQLTVMSPFGKFWRGVGILFITALQGIFEIARFVVRSITDPVDNYKEAKAIDPALGYLSAALSIVVYTAKALYALPLLFPGLGLAGAIAAVAKGVTWLLTHIGLNIAASNTVLALAPLSIGVGLVAAGVKKVEDRCCHPIPDEGLEGNGASNISVRRRSTSSYSRSLSPFLSPEGDDNEELAVHLNESDNEPESPLQPPKISFDDVDDLYKESPTPSL